MKIALPVVKRNEIGKDGNRIVEIEEKEFDVDTSLAMQMRWEARFPELAAKETVVDYAARVASVSGTAGLISKIKVIYCFFDTEMTFERFLKMFDFSLPNYLQDLVGRVTDALRIVFDGAAEKN